MPDMDATEVTGLFDGRRLIVVGRIKCCIPPLFLFLTVET
jgi:hypothetical protein